MNQDEAADDLLSRLVLLTSHHDDRSSCIDILDRIVYKTMKGRLFPILSAASNISLPEEEFRLNLLVFKSRKTFNWCEILLKPLLASNVAINNVCVKYLSGYNQELSFVMKSQLFSIRMNDLENVYKTALFADVNKIVGQNNLFKRSFLLIKSWLFYESQRYLSIPSIGKRPRR
jgi:hypothetical protein